MYLMKLLSCLALSIGLLLLPLDVLCAEESTTGFEKRTAPIFIRLEEENGQVLALQTAVAKYRNPEGSVEVDLVSAIHIGDAAYFQELNERFKKYDVVLYELVAPPDKLVPEKDAQHRGMLAMFQELMTDVLGLSHQLQLVDYTARNFVHADLSPEGMQKALTERGETPLSLLLGITADFARTSTTTTSSTTEPKDESSELERLMAMATDPDGSRKLKQQFARQFGAPNAMAAMPKAVEASLIQDRNGAAMKVFDEQVKQLLAGRAAGSSPLKIAIFYGAAHNTDFHRRLITDYPLLPCGTEWMTAWNMRGPETVSPAFRVLIKSLGELMRAP